MWVPWQKIRWFLTHRKEIENLGREAARIARKYTIENYQNSILKSLMAIAEREKISV